jgi:hypothetical protein
MTSRSDHLYGAELSVGAEREANIDWGTGWFAKGKSWQGTICWAHFAAYTISSRHQSRSLHENSRLCSPDIRLYEAWLFIIVLITTNQLILSWEKWIRSRLVIPHLIQIRFNIFPYTTRSIKLSLPSVLPHLNSGRYDVTFVVVVIIIIIITNVSNGKSYKFSFKARGALVFPSSSISSCLAVPWAGIG